MGRVPATLHTYRVPQQGLDSTRELLRERGVLGFEAVVLWIGTIDSETTATVSAVLRPGQTAYRGDGGCAVEVTPDALSKLISSIPADNYVLARIHTHPADAYHSRVDDTNMLIAHEGAISIVVPDFAAAPLELSHCSVNELRSHSGWRELTVEEVAERFVIT